MSELFIVIEVKLTSSSSGSRVTLCMGRMRKEIMGRPPHSPLPSICFKVSLNAVLLFLIEGKRNEIAAHPAALLPSQLVTACPATHSRFCSVLCWKVSLEQ